MTDFTHQEISKSPSTSGLLALIATAAAYYLFTVITTHGNSWTDAFVITGVMLAAIAAAAISARVNREQRLQVHEKIIVATAVSFAVYYALQSPVFSASSYALELAYFALKAVSLVVLVLVFRWSKNAFSGLALLAYYLDCGFIEIINLGVAQSTTAWYGIWEAAAGIYVLSMIGRRWLSTSDARLTMLLVCAHFANYTAAGIAKLTLEGPVLSWLQNSTFTTLARAEAWGLGGVSYYASIFLALPFVDVLQTGGNAFVLTAQLASIIAPLLPILLAPLTVAYDIFHLFVGIFAGIWFYKWAVVNIVIFHYRREVSAHARSFSVSERIFLCAFVVFCSAYTTIVPLGWYETRQGNFVRAYVHTTEGMHQVHQHFFGTSENLLHKSDTGFPVRTLLEFSTQKWSEVEAAAQCALPPSPNPEWEGAQAIYTAQIRKFMEDRSWLSAAKISIQPFHFAIPNTNYITSPLQIRDANVLGMQFDFYEVCFDDKNQILKEEVLGSFYVEK